jgi:non-specific serine/threonine protein kinase
VLPELAETTAIEIGPLGAKAASAAEPAVRLFAERAMMANPHFAVTPENANDILAICSQLSGVPLAIEVACGYLAHVDVQELARRVREGATSDVSSIVAQTLSWRLQLLPQDDREIFLSLSIFDADFSLADAQALGGAQPPEHALERLSAAFLLVREAGAHGARFRLLDPVRAFAREELSEDDADRLRRRFIAYAAALGSISSAHAAQLAPTILAALRFAAALPDAVHDGLRVIANAAIPIGLGGFATATLQRVGELIERPGADASDAYDAALEAWSWLLSRCGQPRAAAQVNASRIERARSSGDSAGLAAALATSIIASRNIGEFALAAAYGEEAIALTRGCGESRTLAKALRGLASVRMMEDRMREAADLFEELLALGELAVEETEYTMALHDYAVTLRALDRRMEAAALLRRCIQRALAASDYATAIHAQVTLARLSLDAGNIGEAHRLLKGTLPLCRHDINPITRMYAFEDLATASFKDGQYETLALALGYIDRARERAQFKAGAPQAEYIGKIRATVRSHLSAEIYQAEYRRGRMATLDEAFVQLESLEPGTVTLDAAERFAPLSAREREVAQLAAQGLTNREIAEKLIVSVRTVDAHMATIFRKLGIESRDQLIR